VCFGQTNPTFTAIDVTGSVEWHESVPPTPALTGSVGTGIIRVPSNTTQGVHTVYAVQRQKGCVSEPVSKTYEVKVVPGAPTTVDAQVCEEIPNIPVSATGDVGSFITWYSNSNKTGQLIASSLVYTSGENLPGTYTYYASQTVNGCSGVTAPAVFTIKSLPAPPPVDGSPKSICEYESDPSFTATPAPTGTVKWYKEDKTSFLQNGVTYNTDRLNGTVYYASQVVNGCESKEKTEAKFILKVTPSNPSVTNITQCYGVDAYLTTNGVDNWYSDLTATNLIKTGNTLMIDSVLNSVTYYVVRQLNGCFSDTIPCDLTVIPKPSFSIGNDTTICIYNPTVTIQANTFNPTPNGNSLVEWQMNFGKAEFAIDDNTQHSITPSTIATKEGVYSITARYRYKVQNFYCSSDTISIKYKINPKARTPIVTSTVICQDKTIQPLQSYGSPYITWTSLDGAEPKVFHGQRYIFNPAQEELAVGDYRFELYDSSSITGCLSDTATVSMTVAPAAKTKIVGSDSVCVNTTETYYTEYTPRSEYFWDVTGNRLNYSKDENSSSVRYVDWTAMGIDTLTVYERTWAGCEGVDTLVVYAANYPVPHFSYTMPGASNVIEFTDSTMQD
jgi:hypothetical protein